jgi:hypothetical protein
MPSVQQVFPAGTSEILQYRFMRMLQTKGLVGGCNCGCRGDYTLTLKGLELLSGDCNLSPDDLNKWKGFEGY